MKVRYIGESDPLEFINGKEYEKLGISRNQYIYRVRKGLLPRKNHRNNQRFSGLDYTNSEEKLNAIKEKYKNGVTREILEEMF